MGRVARHPDGSKNKICQRASVLESQSRPSRLAMLLCSYPSLGMASGVNLEEKSELYTTTCWQLLRRRWCQTVMALLFLLIHHRRGEGGGWGGRGGGVLHEQQPVLHITLPRLTSIQSPTPTSTSGEDTPASPSAWTRHGEQQIPVTSHC